MAVLMFTICMYRVLDVQKVSFVNLHKLEAFLPIFRGTGLSSSSQSNSAGCT